MSKRSCLFALTGLLAAFTVGSGNCASSEEEQKSSKTIEANQNQSISKQDIQRLSEAFGHFIGRNLNSPGIQFDIESIIKGMREGVSGKPSPMSDEEYEDMMSRLQEQTFKKMADENLSKANEFMKGLVGKQGVVEVVPGKIYYEIITEGTGPQVEEHSSPLINYKGQYIDGSVFGSSEGAGGPITIPLDQTIPGFSKGIVGMKEGEKRKLYVHPEAGYGTSGHMPPNSLLIFEIELVKASSPQASENEEEEELMPLVLEDESSDVDEEEADVEEPRRS